MDHEKATETAEDQSAKTNNAFASSTSTVNGSTDTRGLDRSSTSSDNLEPRLSVSDIRALFENTPSEGLREENAQRERRGADSPNVQNSPVLPDSANNKP
ncbi:unnamed protein product [Enterobius vermicularis]|uniref:Uncharacterized protein n=1 Tax=Enterobius vermicularis TaxID=51028 RepID=A0A0N4VRD3_ENTVE|nr:unnamed protein product [Enterobius vermicularis]